MSASTLNLFEPHAIRFEPRDFRLFVLFGNGLGVEVIRPQTLEEQRISNCR
jgi:hypothetical protein